MSVCQTPLVKAIYYDRAGLPYKIETKQIENNLQTYITHFNDISVCVKRFALFKADTTIIKEETYRILSRKSKLEEFQDFNSWVSTYSVNGDTVWLHGSKRQNWSDYVSFQLDTMLTGKAAIDYLKFAPYTAKSRVTMILNAEIKFNTDSLQLRETVLAYYIKGIPVKVESFDERQQLQSSITSIVHQNEIVYKYYFQKYEPKPYQIDTIAFNSDTTEISINSTSFESISSTNSMYQIAGAKLVFSHDGTSKKQIEYLDSTNIFRNILIGRLIYSDVLYYMELRYFDREKIVGINSSDKNVTNIYSYDTKQRIKEQVSHENGALRKKVHYTYED